MTEEVIKELGGDHCSRQQETAATTHPTLGSLIVGTIDSDNDDHWDEDSDRDR